MDRSTDLAGQKKYNEKPVTKRGLAAPQKTEKIRIKQQKGRKRTDERLTELANSTSSETEKNRA